jgi:hypothetical protein
VRHLVSASVGIEHEVAVGRQHVKAADGGKAPDQRTHLPRLGRRCAVGTQQTLIHAQRDALKAGLHITQRVAQTGFENAIQVTDIRCRLMLRLVIQQPQQATQQRHDRQREPAPLPELHPGNGHCFRQRLGFRRQQTGDTRTVRGGYRIDHRNSLKAQSAQPFRSD